MRPIRFAKVAKINRCFVESSLLSGELAFLRKALFCGKLICLRAPFYLFFAVVRITYIFLFAVDGEGVFL